MLQGWGQVWGRWLLAVVVLCLLPHLPWATQPSPIALAERADPDRERNTQVKTTPKAGLALVIGNSNYAVGRLNNPVNDARLIAETLRKLGFEVTPLFDASQAQMKRAIIEFSDKLEGDGGDGVGLFYYAGHGTQVDGRNFLIPVDAPVNRDKDLAVVAVEATSILEAMHAARNRLNFVILDACRNDPFPRGTRSATQGLARMGATHGTLIAYATSPGEVAADGEGANSPYSAALASELLRPHVAVERMFRQVRNRVMQQTNQRQVPWESSSLTGDDYVFNSGQVPAGHIPAPISTPLLAPTSSERGEPGEALSFYLDFLTRPAGGGSFRKFRDGDTLSSGDLYKILIRPEADGYLYIFQVDSSGAVLRLFPMAEYGGLRLNNLNPIGAGGTYYLPATNKAFQLDDQRGKEAIYVFASRQPRPEVEDLSAALASARTAGDHWDTETAQERLKALFKSRDLPLEPVEGVPDAPAYAFVQDGATFEAVASHFRSTCATCIHVLEFRHR